MQAMGSNGRVVMDFETTPGSPKPIPTGIALAFIKSNAKAEQNQNASNVIRGRRDPAEPYRGFVDVAGDMELPLDLRQTGYILRAAFGEPETTNDGSHHTHVFRLGKPMPSFTLEQGFPDIATYARYDGCKISKLSFSFGGDNELTTPVTIMGIKETLLDESFDPTAVAIPENKLNFDNAAIKEDGAYLAAVTEAKIDIDFTLDGETHCLGGKGFRRSVNDGIVQISGSIKAIFESRDLLEKAISGRKSSVEIELVKEPYSLTICLPEVIYKRSTPGIDGPQGVQIELQYNAFYSQNGKNTSIECVLINDIESYTKPPAALATAGIARVGSAII